MKIHCCANHDLYTFLLVGFASIESEPDTLSFHECNFFYMKVFTIKCSLHFYISSENILLLCLDLRVSHSSLLQMSNKPWMFKYIPDCGAEKLARSSLCVGVHKTGGLPVGGEPGRAKSLILLRSLLNSSHLWRKEIVLFPKGLV